MSLLENEKFICIDCETTGLDPKEDRIIEVAVVLFDLNEIFASFESLVDPECAIPETSIAIHNITPAMVENKPKIETLLPEIIALIKDYTIVGHGVGFDIELLINAAERHGISHNLRKNRILDTLRMARLYGDCPVNSLEQLRKHFNIPMEGAHRAMNDVIVNREVFRHLAKRYKTTKQLFEALSRPVLMKTIPLGKHKGRPFKEVPLQYLYWMANKEFDQDLEFSIKTELKRRKQGNSFNQVGNPFLHL